MNKIFNAAAFYAVLGLLAGVFYREYTRTLGFAGETHLSTLHTHLLVLGLLFFLVLLALGATLRVYEHKQFNLFFWIYNAGVLWTTSMMAYKGIAEVQDPNFKLSPMMSGLSGIGHILITVGLFLLFVVLKKQIKKLG